MILRGKHYMTGEVCDFHIDEGLIKSITPPVNPRTQLGGDETWVCPGLLDIQVNGYGGNDFCSGELGPQGVVSVAEQLTAAGVTGYCPTVTTNSLEAIAASLRAIASAYASEPIARASILGIHLEGPYISPEDGPRGAHPREHVRLPDWDEFSNLQKTAMGLIRIVTIAPEIEGACDFIRRASSAGIVVAIGHHKASGDQIDAAVSAGAVMSTHLGNGCHSQLPRHPNYLWDQLAHDSLMASIIVDGHHLPPNVVKSFFRIKGSRRIVLVSDTLSVAGSPPGVYKFMGLDVEVREDATIRSVGSPYLAGSNLKLADAIGNIVKFADATFSEAVCMATVNPARLLGLQEERGTLAVGTRADIALFRQEDNAWRLEATLKAGKPVYEAQSSN